MVYHVFHIFLFLFVLRVALIQFIHYLRDTWKKECHQFFDSLKQIFFETLRYVHCRRLATNKQILSCLFPSNVFSSSRSRMDTSALRKSREPPRAFASQCERCLLGPFSFPSSVFFSTTTSTSSIPILSIYRYYFLMYFRYTTFFRRLADFHRLRFVAKKKFCRKDRQVF